MLPKISIVTCSYNRPVLLRAAIESLRAQTDPDWEHLIYDEGSTDAGVREVLSWAESDPRVRVWRGLLNRDQPAVVWNFLFSQAQGRYLNTLDDDDEKCPRFVEVMTGQLERDPAVDLVSCGFIVRTEGEADWEHHLNLETPERIERMSTCQGGALVIRREAFMRVGWFAEDIRTNEDWEWLRRAARALQMIHLPECLMIYRQHEANRQKRAEELGHTTDVARILEANR